MTTLEEQHLQTQINKMIKETSHISFKELIVKYGIAFSAGAGIVKILEVLR